MRWEKKYASNNQRMMELENKFQQDKKTYQQDEMKKNRSYHQDLKAYRANQKRLFVKSHLEDIAYNNKDENNRKHNYKLFYDELGKQQLRKYNNVKKAHLKFARKRDKEFDVWARNTKSRMK